MTTVSKVLDLVDHCQGDIAIYEPSGMLTVRDGKGGVFNRDPA